MADYVDHVKKLLPVIYFPLDDVVPGGVARNLGSAGNQPTYHADVKRVHGPIDATGPGRGGACSVNTLILVNANQANPIVVTTGFQSATTASGWSMSYWAKNLTGRCGNGAMLVSPGAHTDAGSTAWIFNPYADTLAYHYGASGALITSAYNWQAAGGKWGMWTHWCLTWSGTEFRVYRNGRVVKLQAGTFTTTGSAAALFKIWTDQGCGMAHAAYWNRTLTPREAVSLSRLRGT